MVESSRKLSFELCELKNKSCKKPINKGDLRSVQMVSARFVMGALQRPLRLYGNVSLTIVRSRSSGSTGLTLLAFGLVHMFLIWNGDILTLYAICGPTDRTTPLTAYWVLLQKTGFWGEARRFQSRWRHGFSTAMSRRKAGVNGRGRVLCRRSSWPFTPRCMVSASRFMLYVMLRAAAAIRVWQCGTQYAGRAGHKAIRRFIVPQHHVGKRRQAFAAIAWRSLQCDEYAAI
jgi:uncharacterized membrane protein YeiB